MDLFGHWNSLVPFSALLSSPHPVVSRWGLRVLCEFATQAASIPRIFRALAVSASVDRVRQLRRLPETVDFANALLRALGVASEPMQPELVAPPIGCGAPALDRNTLPFSDIDLVVVVGEQEVESVRAHRAILAGRSTFFAALFSSGMRDADDASVRVVDVDPEAFVAAIDFAYTGRLPVQLNAQLAVELIAIFMRFGIVHVAAIQELEYALCHQIDSVETALALASLCNLYDGILPQLAFQVEAYLQRVRPSPAAE
jgi:hypothetical protein